MGCRVRRDGEGGVCGGSEGAGVRGWRLGSARRRGGSDCSCTARGGTMCSH